MTKCSNLSGKQIFEKMVSGMYMGELIRQVLVDLMRDDLIFFNCNREKILERGSFYTRSVRVVILKQNACDDVMHN